MISGRSCGIILPIGRLNYHGRKLYRSLGLPDDRSTVPSRNETRILDPRKGESEGVCDRLLLPAGLHLQQLWFLFAQGTADLPEMRCGHGCAAAGQTIDQSEKGEIPFSFAEGETT